MGPTAVAPFRHAPPGRPYRRKGALAPESVAFVRNERILAQDLGENSYNCRMVQESLERTLVTFLGARIYLRLHLFDIRPRQYGRE